MALTQTLLPVIAPTHAVPYDTLQAFALAQTLTASGFATNVNTQLTMGPGRMEGYWALDITNVFITSANEFYQFALLGSNDPNFAAGNVDLIAFYDLASSTATRLAVNSLLGINTTNVPPFGNAGVNFVTPFSNQRGNFVFEFMQLYLTVGGTTPSVTFSSWLGGFTGHCGG